MLQELEKPILPEQKKQVLEAINSLGLRVSPSDVAEKANLPVLVAGQELNRIATETGAHLEVTASGAVVYAFDPRFEQSYALAGPRRFVRMCGRIFMNGTLMILRAMALIGIFLFRISFGVLLVCSVVALVAIAVLAVLALLNQDSDGGGGGDGGGFNIGDLGIGGGDGFASQWSLGYWCFDFLWDWIFFPRYMWGGGYYGWGYGWGYDDYSLFGNPNYDTYGNPTYGQKPKPVEDQTKDGKKPRTKFLDSCFGLLFGEGDPNLDTERQRWQDIAAVIRLNQGVVVSEQLAPYLDGNKENEDWMLPILTRFNGLPDVTETGHIIYLFPAFISALCATPHAITSASQANAEAAPAGVDQLQALYAGHLNRQKVIKRSEAGKAVLERYLTEKNWVLLPEDGEYESVFIFVGLALALSSGLLYASGSVHFLHQFVPLFYVIIGYALTFVIFPAVRYMLNGSINAAIDARNEKRLEASAKLSSPSADLQQKLEEARAIAISSMTETDNRVVYTTEKDVLEQQFEQ